jgi:hypothetical protein
MIHAIWSWLLAVSGTHIPAGQYSNWYNFWSGFGSDIGEVTIIVGLVAWWKQGECHVDKCHKRGKYPFQHFKLCRVHHPGVPDKITHLHIKQLHKRDTINSSTYER